MMEYTTNGKKFTFSKNIRDNRKYRLSFDELAQKTFGLSFERWYKAGFWTDKYQPYVLLDGEKIASNASVSIMDTVWKGVPKRYIQLGTVMTDREYRNMGLSKILIHQILEEWQDHCDAVYLYANDSVLNFYPKYGFVKAHEYQTILQVKPKNSAVRKLDMDNDSDITTLYNFYKKSNPFSELPMIDNWGLLMFYCSAFMKDCVYYIENLDAVVIAEKEQDTLTIFDVYCESCAVLAEVASAMAAACPGCAQIRLGFGLKNPPEDKLLLLQEKNSTLFVLDKKENVFKNHKTMLPLLSHA